MLYEYLPKQNRHKHKSATQNYASWLSTRPELFQKQRFSFIETCFYVHVFFRPNAGLRFLYSRGFYQTSVADRLFSFIF